MLSEIYTTEGRLNRLAYLKCFAILFVASIVVNFVVTSILGNEGTLFYIVSFIVSLPIGVGSFMTGIRRLHDLNRSGWFIIAAIIPFLNLFLEIYMLCFKGTDGPNNYGADPLAF